MLMNVIIQLTQIENLDNMETYKKFNECKIGDILYCHAYGIDDKPITIIPLTILDIVTNGPDIDRHVYSKEAIIIKEKVPNTSEGESEFVIDQYYRVDECMSSKYDIYTTWSEAYTSAIEDLLHKLDYANKQINNITKEKELINQCISELKNTKYFI